MVQNDSSSGTYNEHNGESRQMIDYTKFYGIIAIMVGISQLPLAMALSPEHSLWTFVIGSGGGMLIAIGINPLLGREPFESGWSEEGNPGLLGMVLLTIVTIAVVVASAYIVLPV